MGFRMVVAQLLILITSWTIVQCLVSIPDSPNRQLVRYQYRVKLIHNLLINEGCIKETPVRSKRDIIGSDDVTAQLEIEKNLYQHLFQMLTECRKLEQSMHTNPTRKRPIITSTKAPVTTSSTPTTPITTTTQSSTTPTTFSPVTTKPTTTPAPNCSSGYKLNPVSSTCIRLVQQNVTWEKAKAACEADGEKLAVFPSLESVKWLDSVLSNPINSADWGQDWKWTGLRPVDGGWRWQGRITSSVSTSDLVWDKVNNQPDLSDGRTCGCVTGMYDDSYKKIHDCTCKQTHNFICETA